MSKVTVEKHGDVALLRMTNGVPNAINQELLVDFQEALQMITSECRAMVLAGNPKFFSMGLDLPYVLSLDREGMAGFYENWNQIVLDLYTLPIPTAAAVAGHATAGGAIMAMACDFRIMAAGKTKIGVNEVLIGLPTPYLADLMLRQIVGDRAATNMIFTGKFLSPEEAGQIGLADEVHQAEEVEAKALEKMAALAALRPGAMAAVKATRTQSVKLLYEEHGSRVNQTCLDIWQDPQVRRLLAVAAERFA